MEMDTRDTLNNFLKTQKTTQVNPIKSLPINSCKTIKTFPFPNQKSHFIQSPSIEYDNLTYHIPIDAINRDNFNELKFVNDYLKAEHDLEDEYETENWFHIITIDEIVAFLFSFLSVGSGIIYYENRTCRDCKETDPNIFEDYKNIALAFCSLGVLFFLLTLMPRYYHYLKLYRSAKYVENDKSFLQTNLWQYALFESIIAIVHPNLIFHNLSCKTSTEWNLLEVDYNVNDFLIAISLFRMFDWIRLIISLTNFYCARADRICKMFGMQLSVFYSFKCLLIKHTMEMQILITGIVICALGYMLKVIEGPVYDVSIDYPNKNNFTDLGSCIWYIFVTMTTVGYGDYYTQTLLGKITTLMIAVIGTILVAVNINFFQSKTQLDQGESRALDFIQRIEMKESMKRVAAQYFRANVKYFINKKKYLRGEIAKTETNKAMLLKLAKKKNKSKKEFNGILHKFEIEYKYTSDIDLIKKKILEMEIEQNKTNEKFVVIEEKLSAILN